jgi:hypothetical protein
MAASGVSIERGVQDMRRLVVAVATVAVLALSPGALAAGGLQGKYQTKIASGPLKGTVTLSFGKKGAYTVKGAFGTIKGQDAVAGSKVTFDHEHGSACKGPGKYRFKLTGKSLKLAKISDACTDRSGVLVRTFTKAG